ncbi:MAG TPA: hypothetical protein PLA94_10640, partial [Myxococcota bacterium]|nr:hypothetical protein [Myxococcota bacterium]
LEALKAEIDLSPQSLKESLETVLALDAGRPRFKSEKPGRERLVKPVPAAWKSLLDESLGPVAAGYPALVFDPTHFLHLVGEKLPQRRVYVPEADARLMHLGHALYHQLMSTFARYRFPGGPRSATRWTVRQGFLSPQAPAQAEALILLTVEELAVNQLREPCHHQIRTIALPYSAGRLGEPLPHQPASFWNGPTRRGDEGRAREIWEEVDRDLKNFVRSLEKNINESLSGRLHTAGRAVAEIERSRFQKRRKELEKAASDNQLERLKKEAEQFRVKLAQLSLFSQITDDEQRRLTDLDAEIALRKNHYDAVLDRLKEEEERSLKQILPYRYQLRGAARIYPIAVEIRLPGEVT